MDTRAKLIEALRRLAEWPAEVRAEVLARAHGRLDELEAASEIPKLDEPEEADHDD